MIRHGVSKELQHLFDEHLRLRILLDELSQREQEIMRRLAALLLEVPAQERELSIRDFVARAGRKLAAERQ